MVVCQNVSPWEKYILLGLESVVTVLLIIINMFRILRGCEPQEDRVIKTFCKTKHISMVGANDHRQLRAWC